MRQTSGRCTFGEGSPEYLDPSEFFRRTYLTDSLRQLLGGAVQRLASIGGDPVVQLQTNFGGGKTHSMLALYHLFSGAPVGGLSGMDAVMQETGVAALPSVNRVVLVGNRISPGNPVSKTDGTEVRTLWGELVGQTAGGQAEARRAYERVRADDERATNPGDALRELLNEYGPSLILIDEWVAYARQLHYEGDLPAGSFEIVRRRLFQPIVDPANFATHDNVARAFCDLYRTSHQEFPPRVCRSGLREARQGRVPYPPGGLRAAL